MKRIVLLSVAILTCLCVAIAQSEGMDKTTVEDSIAVSDTTAFTTEKVISAEADNLTKSIGEITHEVGRRFNNNNVGMFKYALLIPILAIIFAFALPAIIIALIVYYRHKNRQAKYQLAAKAIEMGQPVPAALFGEPHENSPLAKGIRNIFLGIGLLIFLWLITDELSIGSIGLLIMCMGIGQVVIHYIQKKEIGKETEKKDHVEVIDPNSTSITEE